MSFKPNQNQQITLNDSFINQTPRTQKIIMNSWCKDFADIVFPAINEGNEELIPKELLHYLEPDDYNNIIYYCKGEDVSPRLEKALLEAAQVKDIMDDDTWNEFQEYKLLIRVLAEQSRNDESGSPVAKDRKEIASTSLQNPSDPDATYRQWI